MVKSRLHDIWRMQFKDTEFSDDEDFFVLGGNSLAMMRIQQGILAEFGVEVPIDQLFREPTVAGICGYIEAKLAS
jgi:acyl carrier protein